MKQFSTEELEAVLRFTNMLADQRQGASFNDKLTDADLDEAERQAREFARSRNSGKRYSPDYGLSETEKGLIQQTKDWLRWRARHGRGARSKK